VTFPLLMPPYADWPDRPACTDADPEAFFPAKGEPVDAAKAICAICPVADECAEWALAHPLDGAQFGVWGGMSAPERKDWRRRNGRRAA
jgi:WhiB family transcriptional regulator, redox-sensing transcriptional regulator